MAACRTLVETLRQLRFVNNASADVKVGSTARPASARTPSRK
jgi:hypothetical protein